MQIILKVINGITSRNFQREKHAQRFSGIRNESLKLQMYFDNSHFTSTCAAIVECPIVCTENVVKSLDWIDDSNYFNLIEIGNTAICSEYDSIMQISSHHFLENLYSLEKVKSPRIATNLVVQCFNFFLIHNALEKCHLIIDGIDEEKISASTAIAILGMTLPVKTLIASRSKFVNLAKNIIQRAEGEKQAKKIISRYR